MSWKDFFVKKPVSVSADTNINNMIIVAPFAGIIVSLDDVPDEVFSKRMIGDGVALYPTECIARTILEEPFHVFTTNHAISYECANGLEIIVHLGIDTVALKGKYFERISEKEEGKASIGTQVVRFEKEAIEKAGFSMVSPIIISGKSLKTIEVLATNEVVAGQPLLKIHTT